MARGIGLIWVYRIFMTGHRFDSRTRDFDITIFTSERIWEIKGIRHHSLSLVFRFWFCCGLRIFPSFSIFFFGPRPKKKSKRSFGTGIQ